MSQSRAHFPPGNVNEPGIVTYYGQITTTTTQVSSATACGKGLTYTSNGAGLYTVTCSDSFYEIIGVTLTVPRLASANAQRVDVYGDTLPNANTGVVMFITSTTVNGAAEDLSTQVKFYFTITGKKTRV